MESPCKGGLDVSEKALLSMLGPGKFQKKSVVSDSEQKVSDVLAVLAEAEGNMDVAASRLGIAKSSLKRMISSSESYPSAYDEANPLGTSRKYLEKTMGRWSVVALNPTSGSACLEMNSGKAVVRLSVTVNIQKNSWLT